MSLLSLTSHRTTLTMMLALTLTAGGPLSLPVWAAGDSFRVGAGVPAAQRPRIAVVDFRAVQVEKGVGEGVAENLRTALIRQGGFLVLERSAIQQVLKEQAFGKSGFVDERNAVSLGKLLGAKLIVVGSVTKLGSNYTVNARVIDVTSGEAVTAESLTTRNDDDLVTIVSRIASSLGEMAVATQPPAPAPAVARPSAPPARTVAAPPAKPPQGNQASRPKEAVAPVAARPPAAATMPPRGVTTGAIQFVAKDTGVPGKPSEEARQYRLGNAEQLFPGLSDDLQVTSELATTLGGVPGGAERLSQYQTLQAAAGAAAVGGWVTVIGTPVAGVLLAGALAGLLGPALFATSPSSVATVIPVVALVSSAATYLTGYFWIWPNFLNAERTDRAKAFAELDAAVNAYNAVATTKVGTGK